LVIIAAGLPLILAASCRGWEGAGSTPVESRCDKQTDTAFVSLNKQGDTGIYNGDPGDPLVLCPRPGARITKVRNDSGHNFSLAHGGSGFVIMRNGAAVEEFDGKTVAGNWSAQYGGELNSAPLSLTVKVDWIRP